MESAVPMLLFLGALLGFGFLIMYCLYQDKELERAEQEAGSRPVREVPAASGFFQPIEDDGREGSDAAGPGIRNLEQYLRTQETLATGFVNQPSVDRLLRRPGSEIPTRVFDCIERFIRNEEQLVMLYLADPKVECLHLREAQTVAA